jgi:hypothetical protein
LKEWPNLHPIRLSTQAWLLKKSLFKPNEQNFWDEKCLSIREDRSLRIVTEFYFREFRVEQFFNTTDEMKRPVSGRDAIRSQVIRTIRVRSSSLFSSMMPNTPVTSNLKMESAFSSSEPYLF